MCVCVFRTFLVVYPGWVGSTFPFNVFRTMVRFVWWLFRPIDDIIGGLLLYVCVCMCVYVVSFLTLVFSLSLGLCCCSCLSISFLCSLSHIYLHYLRWALNQKLVTLASSMSTGQGFWTQGRRVGECVFFAHSWWSLPGGWVRHFYLIVLFFILSNYQWWYMDIRIYNWQLYLYP